MDENKVGLSYKCADNLSFRRLINSHCAMLASKSFPFILCVWLANINTLNLTLRLPLLQLAITEFATARCLAFSECPVSWTQENKCLLVMNQSPFLFTAVARILVQSVQKSALQQLDSCPHSRLCSFFCLVVSFEVFSVSAFKYSLLKSIWSTQVWHFFIFRSKIAIAKGNERRTAPFEQH